MLEVNLPPKVVDYQDYRNYLTDFYKFKKATTRSFSFRKFSQISGIKSTNYLMLVMQKKRKLSPQIAAPIAKAMKLSRSETAYFVSLVRLEQAKDQNEREKVDRERKIAIRKIMTRVLPLEKQRYLSTWYFPLVRELGFLTDFSPSADWISTKLQGMITPDQAEKAMKTLIDLGLWRMKGGKVVVHDLVLDTGDDSTVFNSATIANVHKDTLVAWSKIIESIPVADRELGLINIPISSEKIPELKRRICQFQDELIGWLQDEKNPDQLVQLGTYLVPVTK